MQVIYDVTIEPTKKKPPFHISWQNPKTRTIDSFDQDAKITPYEARILWQYSAYQTSIGKKLFRFLDGNSRHFLGALNKAHQQAESLQLNLRTCEQIVDWPFELLTESNIFQVPYRVHLVRRVSDWGSRKKIYPKKRPLKLLIMACSAINVKPELDFEREEEAIFKITEDLPIDMEVEDSGSLEGLRTRLEQEEYDVVYLSGYTGIDKKKGPYFIMEDEIGYKHQVYPDELWGEALVKNTPRLLFLSVCRIGKTPVSPDEVSFGRLLAEKHHVPAVLSWGRSMSDQATHPGMILFRELSRGQTILDAVQRARAELTKNFPHSSKSTWPLLRLFSSGIPLNAIVKKGQKSKPKFRQTNYIYLRNSQVKVLKEGFVGRRRQLQQSLRALKHALNKVGLLLLGAGGLGKSCLAGKISERLTDYTLIIVHGEFNAITLEAALIDAFKLTQDKKGQRILSQNKVIRDKLINLCATSFKKKKYLLLLDDFDQNLDSANKGQPGSLSPVAAELMKVLLHYLPFTGKMTQLIITSRYSFSLTEQGINLVEDRLEKVWLTSFQEAEQYKKALQLKHILDYPNQSLGQQLLEEGHGNPRLMEWLNVLAGKMAKAKGPQLLEAIKNKQKDFIREHVIRELLCQGGKELRHFLIWFSIYRQPVPEEGIKHAVKKAGSKGWEKLLRKGMSLSLVEYDQIRETYQVTPLLREELVNELEEIQQAHEEAFTYYKMICEARETFDPLLVEEWIFHALGCGAEDTASEQGARLVKYLQERLAFRASKRVGEWILNNKKRHSTKCDADLLNTLGSTLHILGHYQKACDYIKQALDILMQYDNGRHPQVTDALNNLGLALQALGNHKKAIERFEQALSIDRSMNKEMHPSVARDLNKIGAARQELGHHGEAIKCFEQALGICKKIYGEIHPEVAFCLNNLGSVWSDRGDYEKAIDYFEQALTICKQVYGEKHPDVANCLNTLGSVWGKRGDHEKAIDYINQALDILMECYEGEHPYVTETLNNLGLELQALGHHKKAIERFEQALFNDRSLYGEMHPSVARDLNKMGSARQELGHHGEAIKCFEQALDIWEEVYGEDHPQVAEGLIDLASLLFKLNEKQKAKDYFDKAYEILNKHFGPEHPKTKEVNERLKKCQ